MFSIIEKLRDEKAQATVEAAFALPVLMLLVLLLVQPGIILYDRIVMESAATEGCRLLSTSPSGNAALCEDYVRRRLSAVPQIDLFHVHTSGCSWNIALSGNETSDNVKVDISTEVKPLPLLGLGAKLIGATNGNGNFLVQASASSNTQPNWVQASAGGTPPSAWIGI